MSYKESDGKQDTEQGVQVMKWMVRQSVGAAAMTAVLMLGGGCAAFRASTQTVDVNQEMHMDARYDASDMRTITADVVDQILTSPFLMQHQEPPVMMIAGVQNRTLDHVDTKNITDRIRTLLLNSGEIRFVNEARRADLLAEQGFQAANVSPDQQVVIGRQLGAQYMISGSFAEIKRSSPRQVRISRQELRYYKFTLEVTDLETSEILWIAEQEFARLASKPLIGW